MENKVSRIKVDLAEKLDIPKEAVLDIPRIEVVGKEEITIENHKGIILFKTDIMKIKSSLGNIVLKGAKFEILFISGKTIVLGGKLKSIEYEGD